MLEVVINSPNPKGSPKKGQLYTYSKSGRTISPEGEPMINQTFIRVKPREKYIMKDVEVNLPAYYQMYAFTENYDFDWHALSGPLSRNENRRLAPPKNKEGFIGNSIIYDSKYNDSTKKGNFGITLESAANLEE